MAVKEQAGARGPDAVGDFRAAPMPPPEARGKAKNGFQRAWHVYTEALSPVVEPAARVIGRELTFDLMGFLLTWQLQGGFEGMQRDLKMSRSSIYRLVSALPRVTGQRPDVFTLPGVKFDVAKYLAGAQLIA